MLRDQGGTHMAVGGGRKNTIGRVGEVVRLITGNRVPEIPDAFLLIFPDLVVEDTVAEVLVCDHLRVE